MGNYSNIRCIALSLLFTIQNVIAWVPTTPLSTSSSYSSLLNTKTFPLKFYKKKSIYRQASATSSIEEQTSPSSSIDLMLFNSKNRSKEKFQPIVPNKVSMYTCGPTVYDYAHVGNFRAFLTYDLMKRVLMYFGYDVTHICNLTDVDDKIINRANEQGIKNISELTLKYEQLFFNDLHALNIILADKYPRATEHIPEMINMILELEQKGLAYETPDGSWYFATDKKEGYGEQLVNLKNQELEVSERGENEMKHNPQDFCLWKAYKPDIDRLDAIWESQEGKIQKGRPGWHLECSAMARKYLGDSIDLHGGGVDLQFPHHENEIAQSEGATGKTFCNCWFHNGFVNINNEKMSKSLGNFLTLRTACPKADDVRAYRYLAISSQYRTELSFTDEAMTAAKNALKRIDKVKNQIAETIQNENTAAVAEATTTTTTTTTDQSELVMDVVPKAMSNFEAALLDDLTMPRAAAAMFSLVKAAEKEFKRKKNNNDDTTLDIVGLKAIQDALDKMDQVFGIFYTVPLQEGEEESSNDDDDGEIPTEVLELVSQRSEAKEAKDWELADSLRARITELGFKVKDVKGGDPIISRV